MTNRPKIPEALVVKVLAANLHSCCFCHGNNLHVHIHHIDGDREHNEFANLAVLCPNCHSRVTGDEGLGRRFTQSEVIEYKRKWEANCAKAIEARGETALQERALAAEHERDEIQALDFTIPLFSNPVLARAVGALVGVKIEDRFGPYLLDRLVKSLEREGWLRKGRPATLAEYRPNEVVFETVEATKVLFPRSVLNTTVPELRELAVWIADPDTSDLGARSDDRFDFTGTFLYLVTPLYDDGSAASFFSGCSALQVISNLLKGESFLKGDSDEPLGRQSYLHPVDKLKSLGGIIIDRRTIETLYRCRYMTDEQCFNDGARAFRVHDLLAYPLYIGNPLENLIRSFDKHQVPCEEPPGT
jgi:hypothetical protein